MKTARAFTIVELLIVIVVIAILATLTIVAYNGIQQRAQTTAASSALSQASRKLKTYEIDNGLYPTQLSDAGITDSATTYQYTVNNSTNPKTFCITATNGTTSYYITSTSIPTSGGCAGHGQGGVAAVTNLVTDPGAEGASIAWEAAYGTSGAGVLSISNSGAHTGANLGRMTWSTAPSATQTFWISPRGTIPLNSSGVTYIASGYVRTSWSGSSFRLNAVPRDGSMVYSGGEVYGTVVSVPANTWTRVSVAITIPFSSTQYVQLRLRHAGGTLPVAGSTLEGDSFMLTEGTTLYNYADGSSPNWTWNGTPNNSTSTGPPV